ncbi:MAG: hypothetical protein N2663_01745 [Chlorobi bacterium]|nr:hypothetical protein [Chlorobiota bacterium]
MRWCVLVLSTIAHAQVLSIIAPDTLPARFSAWSNLSHSLRIVSPASRAVRILLCIEGNNLRACTPFAAQPVVVLRDTIVLPLSALLSDLLATTEPLVRTAFLLHGRYRLCFTLTDPSDSSKQFDRQCREFTVAGPSPVELVGDRKRSFPSNAPVHLSWRAAIASPFKVAMEVCIVECLPGQSPWHAVMTGHPIATCTPDAIEGNQWTCIFDAAQFIPGRRYAWGVFIVGGKELLSDVGEFIIEKAP